MSPKMSARFGLVGNEIPAGKYNPSYIERLGANSEPVVRPDLKLVPFVNVVQRCCALVRSASKSFAVPHFVFSASEGLSILRCPLQLHWDLEILIVGDLGTW